jgi:hypothetical protein
MAAGLAATVGLLLAVAAAEAAPPGLSGLSRRGVQRGVATVIAVDGRNLGPDTRVLLPAGVAVESQSVKGKPKAGAGRVEIELTVSSAAEPGVYPLRLANADGVSGMMLFEVGEVAEFERPAAAPAPDAPEKAVAVPALPVTVNGAIPGTTTEWWRVHLKAGQRLSAEVLAQRIGVPVLPVLEVTDADGRTVAAGRGGPATGADVRLSFTAAAEGDYLLSLHDLMYRGGGSGQYRLRLGDFDYADSVTPLGGRRGSTVEVTFHGGTLKAPVKAAVDLSRVPEGVARVPVRLPGSPAPAFALAVSDGPEFASSPTATAVSGAATFNGVVSTPRKSDRIPLRLPPGKWRFEVAAASLGSPLNPTLTLTRPDGGGLMTAPDRADSPDPAADFTVGPDLPELVAVVGDLHRRGGPGFAYRLTVRPVGRPDFSLSVDEETLNIPAGGTAVLRVKAVRDGYAGPITLLVPGLPEGVVIGGAVIPEGRTFALLTLTAPADARLSGRPLAVLGMGTTDEGSFLRTARRVTSPAPEGGPLLSPIVSSDLPGGIGEPTPVEFAATAADANLLPGVPFTLNVRVGRRPGVEGADGAVALSLLTDLVGPEKNNPAALEQQFVKAKAGQTVAAGTAEGKFTLDVERTLPLDRPVGIVVQGTLTDKSGKTVATLFTRRLTVTAKRPYAAELAEATVKAPAGGKAVVKGKIVRVAPFNEPVMIRLDGLPGGWKVPGVTVKPGESDFAFDIAIPANAKPGEFKANLAANWSDGQNNPYKLPPLPLTVTVTPAAAVPAGEKPKADATKPEKPAPTEKPKAEKK